MYSFYLDKTKVAEPESFTNISFEKKRDGDYFGFIQRQKGTVKVIGAGQVKFTEPKAVAILKAAKGKDGYGAIIKFIVKYNDILAYQGTVNMWNAEWYSESVVVTFSDDSEVVKFITNANKVYQITPNKTQLVGGSGIIGKTTHQINESLSTFRKKTKLPESFGHVVPFQSVSGSSNSNVDVITSFSDIKPIFTNDSERKTVSIGAVIKVNAKAGQDIQVKVNDIITNVYSISSTATDYTFLISEQFIIEPYQSITVNIVSLGNSDDIIFDYDFQDTVLNISEIKDVVKTNVPCISSFDIISQLIANATNSELILESDFLSNLSHDWSNGKNVRGVESTINTSFNDLFSDLNKIYCLICDVIEGKVVIERRKEIEKRATKSYLSRDRIVLGNGQAEVRTPNRAYLYSGIKVGYKNWQGESALSNQEINALQEWGSDLFGRENILNLECNCIASGILINEIQQLQFGKISNEQQKKYDETLICLIPDDGYENYKTFGVNEDSMNLSIRPLAMLKNWAEVLGGYKYWVFISGIGNTDSIILEESQKAQINTFGNIISDDAWDLVYICELWEYTNIGGIIYWRDTLGNDRKGILVEAQWSNEKQMLLSIIETL